jgi:dipeptidyl aminopeptidase/acylaminoacyl peptidase
VRDAALSDLQIAPYGFWKSPITSDRIVAEVVRLGEIALDGDAIYWSEGRPNEGGRYVIVRRSPEGEVADLTPSSFNARTRVHEYGGGAFTVHDGVIYFSNFSDQRLYRQGPGEAPQPITPEGEWRYADGVIDRRRTRMICVREDHTGGRHEPVNALASVDLAGRMQPELLVAGSDFYSSPRLSPDGTWLAWLAWNHPNMPWDGTELWVGEIGPDGSVGARQKIAGGPDESIAQPEWSPDGTLYFVSDRTGWWNLYRWSGSDAEPLLPMEAEFAEPPWVFGTSSYAFLDDGHLLCAFTREGTWQLAEIDLRTKAWTPVELPYTDFGEIHAAGGRVVFFAASPSEPLSLIGRDRATRQWEALRRSTQIEEKLRPYFSCPEPVEFPTENGLTAHGLFYPPHNPDWQPPDTENPPLLVKCHGGPTSAASSTLSLSIQYWTSRGIAVLDVNYGGSTGYGRSYRKRLEGQWGVVDVDDCVNGARFLAEQGRVDGRRMAISGGSAGGYTVLCALTFRRVFSAGASYYGVSDLEALARDTHKFEARYLDRLIGPYPEARDLYCQRSPIHFTEKLAVPVIFLQGAEDRIVPPNQAEAMVDALRAKQVPVAYYLFEGEQHGFRRAENIKRALDAELAFYATLLFHTGLRF